VQPDELIRRSLKCISADSGHHDTCGSGKIGCGSGARVIADHGFLDGNDGFAARSDNCIDDSDGDRTGLMSKNEHGSGGECTSKRESAGHHANDGTLFKGVSVAALGVVAGAVRIVSGKGTRNDPVTCVRLVTLRQARQ
jgi:hypothetical protein